MDVLSDILSALRFRGTLYFTTEFSRPWGLRVPKFQQVARFHLVTRGSCWVRVMPNEAPILLEGGDLILIPHGTEHVLADTADTPCRTMDEVVRAAGFTGTGALVIAGEDTGAPTRMVCGHLAFDEGFDDPLLAQLPPAIVVRWDQALKGAPLDDIFRFITRELQEARPGHQEVARRLSEVLFVQAVRSWADREGHDRGLLAALADRGLGEALAAIHREPSTRWTLDALARRAAMGRTAFAERFRAVVGETPHQYVARWRMRAARRLLTESELPLDRIAAKVGYGSAAAFSRVFSQRMKTSPGAFRRAERRPSGQASAPD